MYDELERKSRPTLSLSLCAELINSVNLEELNRLNWYTLIKQQTAVSVKWNFFCSQSLCMRIVYYFYSMGSALFNKFLLHLYFKLI